MIAAVAEEEFISGNVIFYVSIILAILFVGLAHQFARWRDIDIWQNFPKHRFRYYLLGAVLILDFALLPLLEEYFPIPDDPEVEYWLSELHWTQAVIAFALCAAIWEEYVFHGLLLNWIYRRWDAWLAILIPNVIWSALHVQYDLFWIGTLFVSGCLWSLIRLCGMPLWILMLFHFVNNVLALILQ